MVYVVTDMLEIGELVDVLGPASRREQEVASWLDVFPLPIVGVGESFRMKPHSVCFGLSASTQPHEEDVRIDGLVGVTAR